MTIIAAIRDASRSEKIRWGEIFTADVIPAHKFGDAVYEQISEICVLTTS